jgi:hypothetical protein
MLVLRDRSLHAIFKIRLQPTTKSLQFVRGMNAGVLDQSTAPFAPIRINKIHRQGSNTKGPGNQQWHLFCIHNFSSSS